VAAVGGDRSGVSGLLIWISCYSDIIFSMAIKKNQEFREPTDISSTYAI
jgi:hypothetical protein